MTAALCNLSTADLRALSAGLRAGRIRVPFSILSLQRVISHSFSQDIAAGLAALDAAGMTSESVAYAIDLVVADRVTRIVAEDAIDLVTSGPNESNSANRDTAVVVRDMFSYAESSVWIAGYAIHRGRKIFQALSDRMVERPSIEVVLLLDVKRGLGDTTARNDLVRRFTEQFKKRDWPEGRPMPKVLFFPRSLELEPSKKAALHAKCIVVDSSICFVSSANFTEAAQNKNIEIGLLVRSTTVATSLQRYLESLVANREVELLF